MLIIKLFLVAKIRTSVSFRSLEGVFEIYSTEMNISRTNPSFSSGLLWVKKVGYHQLQQPKQKAKDWILILDESIGIGQEKLLVVLGIRRSRIDFTRPLTMQDMEPIIVKSKKTWTGEAIMAELEICKKLVGSVLYATTDGSSTIKKGLRLAGIKHKYDVTHAIAIMLEKIYKNDEEFNDFTHTMGQMRLKYCCSKYAHIIPPNQRSKSRFLNIDILSNWCMRVLKSFEAGKLIKEEEQLLQWVLDKKLFVEDMDQIITTVKDLSKVLKYNGLNNKSKKQCLAILKSCNKATKQNTFTALFKEYLDGNSSRIGNKNETFLCSSDIIETTFGKYKNELSKNPMTGITDLALIIPAFTSNLDNNMIKTAIDNCSCKQIKEWSDANLCKSLSAKRKATLN